MSNLELKDRMNAAIEQLRLLIKEYNLTPEEEQKKVRNAMYVKHGEFAKTGIKPLLDLFKELEKKHVLREAAKVS